MNNPFSRLKHYLPDLLDPQENHATECLAACLVFSAKIRGMFLAFLFNDNNETKDASTVEVITQHPTERGKFIDLVLRSDNDFLVAVEVKIKDKENDRHKQQLREYRDWVELQRKQNGFLFSLVRDASSDFDPIKHGAHGRRTWKELFEFFQKQLSKSDLGDVEMTLIENLCNYLESEGIVTTYKTSDLLGYAAGIQARTALTGIFYQVASQLEANGFMTVAVEGKKDSWPQLRVQHSAWNKIFGNGGNYKVVLSYCIPGIWGADVHEFFVTIELWHVNHQNDWTIIQPKFANWLEKFKRHNLNWSVHPTWKSKRDNIPASEIRTPPKMIGVWPDDTIQPSDATFQCVETLVAELVNRVKEYASIVGSLDE